MLEVKRSILAYQSIETGAMVKHYALVAIQAGRQLLLSHPNLFLYSQTRSSLQTSNRYSNVISLFYRYLSTQPFFDKADVGVYHVHANCKHIRRWQVARQIQRVKTGNERPSTETIYEDAKVLLIFFKWLIDAGFVTNVNVQLKTWTADFKSNHMLNYIQQQAKVKIDSKNIRVLDKISRQKRKMGLITSPEIEALLISYNDPAYPALFKLSLGTAMRPMDLVCFPYLGNGKNKDVIPYSEMRKTSGAVDYTIESSKGNKSRTIKINVADLADLEKNYIVPHFYDRAAKYAKRYGHKCPPSVLFLNEFGVPITPSMISSRTNYAKIKARARLKSFRKHLTFYEARHWWPTMFLIRFFGEKLLSESADALYAACAEVLTNQMGHEDIETTYRHYIDLARVTLMAHQGHVNELVSDGVSVADMVKQLAERRSAVLSL